MTSPLGYQLSPYTTQMESILGSVQSNNSLPDSDGFDDPTSYVSQDLLDAAAEALSTWKAANQQLLRDMQDMPFASLRPTLMNIANDPTFSTVFAKAQSAGQTSAKQASGSGDKKIGSITFGVTLDMTAGIGIVVGIGLAINPHDLTEFSIYLLGAIPLGIEEEIEVSFDIGFESNTPSELSALKVGAQATLDAPVGMSGTVSLEVQLPFTSVKDAINPSNWSVTVAESNGEGAGVALFGEARLVIVSNHFPLIAQPGGKYMHIIQAVHCGNTMDNIGKDEIVLNFYIDDDADQSVADGKYVYPWWSHFSITEDGDEEQKGIKVPARTKPIDGWWNCYRTIYCNSKFRIELIQGSGKVIKNYVIDADNYDIDQSWNLTVEDNDQTNHLDYMIIGRRKL